MLFLFNIFLNNFSHDSQLFDVDIIILLNQTLQQSPKNNKKSNKFK